MFKNSTNDVIEIDSMRNFANGLMKRQVLLPRSGNLKHGHLVYLSLKSMTSPSDSGSV